MVDLDGGSIRRPWGSTVDGKNKATAKNLVIPAIVHLDIVNVWKENPDVMKSERIHTDARVLVNLLKIFY